MMRNRRRIYRYLVANANGKGVMNGVSRFRNFALCLLCVLSVLCGHCVKFLSLIRKSFNPPIPRAARQQQNPPEPAATPYTVLARRLARR